MRIGWLQPKYPSERRVKSLADVRKLIILKGQKKGVVVEFGRILEKLADAKPMARLLKEKMQLKDWDVDLARLLPFVHIDDALGTDDLALLNLLRATAHVVVPCTGPSSSRGRAADVLASGSSSTRPDDDPVAVALRVAAYLRARPAERRAPAPFGSSTVRSADRRGPAEAVVSSCSTKARSDDRGGPADAAISSCSTNARSAGRRGPTEAVLSAGSYTARLNTRSADRSRSASPERRGRASAELLRPASSERRRSSSAERDRLNRPAGRLVSTGFASALQEAGIKLARTRKTKTLHDVQDLGERMQNLALALLRDRDDAVQLSQDLVRLKKDLVRTATARCHLPVLCREVNHPSIQLRWFEG